MVSFLRYKEDKKTTKKVSKKVGENLHFFTFTSIIE